MWLYDVLDKIFPGSYCAKFGFALALAIGCPVVVALALASGSGAGSFTICAAAVIAWIAAFRSIHGLLSPLARVSASLQRMEAGHRVRPLPIGYRDEIGALMDCANRLARNFDTVPVRTAEVADKDPMTGLLNYRGIERRISSSPSGALLSIGIDNFEEIKDRHGHHVGDQILHQIADLLAATIRERDLLARIGEGFLLCLPGADLERGRQAAERLRGVIEAAIRVDGGAATVSIGVAFGHRNEPFWKVIEAADQAMLAAKSAERNRVVCAAAPSAKSATAQEGDATSPISIAASHGE